jgi:hypothetical protein
MGTKKPGGCARLSALAGYLTWPQFAGNRHVEPMLCLLYSMLVQRLGEGSKSLADKSLQPKFGSFRRASCGTVMESERIREAQLPI